MFPWMVAPFAKWLPGAWIGWLQSAGIAAAAAIGVWLISGVFRKTAVVDAELRRPLDDDLSFAVYSGGPDWGKRLNDGFGSRPATG